MSEVSRCRSDRSTMFLLRWRQRGVWRMLLAIAVCALAIVFLLPYRYHLYWQLSGLQHVRSIPTSPMPESPPPSTWPRCSFGPYEFALPRELAKNLKARRGKNGNVVLVFSDQSRSVVMPVPTDPADVRAIAASLQGDFAIPPEGREHSLTRLRIASYQSSGEDFRWTMTPGQVRWLAWCITMRRWFNLLSATHAEYLLRDDLEGILDFGPPGTPVSFDWQTCDDRFGGSVVFTDRKSEVDCRWIRAVCRSLRFSESRVRHLPENEGELRNLFQMNNGPSGTPREGRSRIKSVRTK